MKALLKVLLGRLGLEVQTARLARLRDRFQATLVEWSARDFRIAPDGAYRATGIVFSRDRALQLDALLESWFAQVDGPAKLVVLWTASPVHEVSYRELAGKWASRVEWVRESNFREDLVSIVERDSSTHLFFMTDDALILRPFAMEQVLLPDPRHEIFSLCHSRDLDWCFVHQKAQIAPPLEPRSDGTFSWQWKDGEAFSDWSFPLSVDGKFFLREEMEVLLSDLPFGSPNTLEQSLQIYQPLFAGRRGVCFAEAAMVNVPCNAVQTQFANPVTGAHSTDELLREWQRGNRIAWEDFKGLPPREAERKAYRFVGRAGI